MAERNVVRDRLKNEETVTCHGLRTSTPLFRNLRRCAKRTWKDGVKILEELIDKKYPNFETGRLLVLIFNLVICQIIGWNTVNCGNSNATL